MLFYMMELVLWVEIPKYFGNILKGLRQIELSFFFSVLHYGFMFSLFFIIF